MLQSAPSSDAATAGKTAPAAGAARPARTWRARLLAALVAPCLLALTAWQVESGYYKQLADTDVLVTALARIAQEHIAGIMRSIDQVLIEIEELRSADGTPDPGLFAALMTNRMRNIPEIRAAFVTDARGVMVAGTLDVMIGTDVHDREYFASLAADPRLDMAISPPLQSRIQPVVSIIISRPLHGADGRFAGIAAVAVDPLIFEGELRTVRPGTGGRASLIRRDGVILARFPDTEQWRGKSVSGGEVMAHLASGNAGTLRGTSITDGAERIVAYRALARHPLVVVVAMSSAEALSSWRGDAMLQIGAALALVLVMFGMAVVSDRRLAERQKIQQDLAATDARYRQLTEHSPVGVFQSDMRGNSLYVNERWAELAGRDRAEMIGSKWCRVVHPDDREAVGLAWERHLSGEGEFLAEMRLVRPDGSVRWVRGHASALSEADGPAGGMVGTIEDITAAKEAERRLRLSEAKFAKAFLASPDAMVISRTADGCYIDLNDAFSAMLGYSRDEFLGRTALDLGVWAEPADRVRLVQMIRRDGQASDFETRLRRKDGREFDVLISVQEIVLEDCDSLLFICRDVSAAKEMEARTRALVAKLDASNQELEQFAYVTSHDLQEPLRMIAGYAQLIDRRYRGRLDSDADEFLSFLVDGARRMQAMIQDLLEYSRVERRGGQFATFEARTVLDNVLRNLGAALEEGGGSVELGVLPRVTADQQQFLRLFQNLIGNALKYRSPDRPPQVKVSAERVGSEWMFSVADNGIGIEAEYFDRIFQVFQRLHTRDKYDGTGIGLAICKKIVERHGGKIRVESVPGQGCTFHFTLPDIPA
ncbi:MAG: PAS domain S-box protein [Magnetospirillum sp.]|nr:PAS domain S-box protein [Magnetospirillum sp.]